ncbi:unnamed protein product, partial [Iphiclides podalirius]
MCSLSKEKSKNQATSLDSFLVVVRASALTAAHVSQSWNRRRHGCTPPQQFSITLLSNWPWRYFDLFVRPHAAGPKYIK